MEDRKYAFLREVLVKVCFHSMALTNWSPSDWLPASFFFFFQYESLKKKNPFLGGDRGTCFNSLVVERFATSVSSECLHSCHGGYWWSPAPTQRLRIKV